MMQRGEHYVGMRAMVMTVQGRRKRRRPKRRWLDKVKDDIKEKRLSADDVYDRQRLSQRAVSPSLRRAVVLQDGCINLRRRVNK